MLRDITSFFSIFNVCSWSIWLLTVQIMLAFPQKGKQNWNSSITRKNQMPSICWNKNKRKFSVTHWRVLPPYLQLSARAMQTFANKYSENSKILHRFSYPRVFEYHILLKPRGAMWWMEINEIARVSRRYDATKTITPITVSKKVSRAR